MNWYKKAFFEIVINNGIEYNWDAVPQAESFGANPKKIIKILDQGNYRAGNVIIDGGWVYTVGIDNQGRRIITKVSKQ